MELMDHQKLAKDRLDNGKILYGGTGSGKSITSLAYYVERESPKDLYIITTARKRDSLDWVGTSVQFGIGTERDLTNHGVLTIDSWNNIDKYIGVKDAFFIFDEQRVVGSGAWVKAFIKICRQNRWILLSATPGDTWLDYAPVFIANGFFRNITEFKYAHVMYEPFNKFPKVKGYINETKLELLRNEVLVEMPFIKHTERVLNWLDVNYDHDMFRRIEKDRWNPYEDRPIKDASEMFRLVRRVVNSDPSRLEWVRKLNNLCHPKLIVFYNFNYELELLRTLSDQVPVFEWNGHKKDPVPKLDKWVYLVQYVSGSEAWECTETDAMVLYSLTYSYKNHYQSQGRTDRLNTPFQTLFYYLFLSNSWIDRGIKGALDQKKSFNEKKYVRENGEFGDLPGRNLYDVF